MDNSFKNMKDEEFLYNLCAMIGKENFIRIADIIGGNCPNGGCTEGKDKCGNCFYDFLRQYEQNNMSK